MGKTTFEDKEFLGNKHECSILYTTARKSHEPGKNRATFMEKNEPHLRNEMIHSGEYLTKTL